MKRKLLFISMCLPYDGVAHAGGKTFNYYLKAFAKEEKNDVVLISKILSAEREYINKLDSRINFLPVVMPENFTQKITAYVKSLNSKLNPWYKLGNTLTKEIYDQIRERLIELSKEGYSPHIIILEWTEMLLFVDEVKMIFPNAKYVASEHDVSFLRLERAIKMEKNILVRQYRRALHRNIKKRELVSIDRCDLVVTHNEKDYNLLINNGIVKEKLGVIVPYYDDFSQCVRAANSNSIIFYGAMNRKENSSAAIWFIEQVLPLLEDLDVNFIVIGNKPPKELLDKQNDRIIVTGFVNSAMPFFAKAMCMVAPLLLGAGIKVKIIEALSAGVPVLTNSIGSEGIFIEDRKEYYHCVTAHDYEQVIRDMVNGKLDVEKVSSNAKCVVSDRYNLEESFNDYSSRVYSLLGDM